MRITGTSLDGFLRGALHLGDGVAHGEDDRSLILANLVHCPKDLDGEGRGGRGGRWKERLWEEDPKCSMDRSQRP